MSLFKDLISSIEPTASNTAPAPSPVSRLASASPKPAQRPTPRANGAAEMPGLKRKASGPVDTSQVKMQRKDATPQPGQTNGALRTAPPTGVAKPNSAATSASVPYRGTAGLGSSKPGIAPIKKANPQGSTPVSAPKAAVPAPRPTTLKSTGSMSGSAASKSTNVTSGSAAAASQKKTGGYMAMLQKAKEKDQTKPVVPPIKHEPTKILTKKDRERIRLEAKAAGKARKPGVSAPAKTTDSKVDAGKEKRKPADLGYQGTARPAKKPVEVGYKGTAKPMAGSAPAGRPGAAAAKSKQKLSQGRYSGYAEWSDLDEMDDEEEDYESDASSDMEGGFYDVEDEEQMALKMAKKEDAEALAEEIAHKREKEERKRKLAALAKGAAAKRRY